MKNLDDLFRFITKQIKGYKKDRGNSLRFKNYYLSVKDDKRSNFAKVFDYSIWRVIVFFIVFLYLYLRTNKLYLSILLSSSSFLLVHSLAIRGRNRKFQQMKNQKRRYIASQRVYSEIMNKTVDEMKEYTQEIFAPLGFSEFNFIESDQRSILLNSVYKGQKIMLLFNIYKNDFEVELKEVKEFGDTLAENNTKRGIIITTSDFTSDSYNYINTLDKSYSLLLINKDKLLKIIEDNGLFPNDEEIDEVIESKISKREKKWDKYKNAALSKNKIKRYIILSIYLAMAAWYTPYTIYYMIVSSIILSLALLTSISNIFNRNKNSQKEEEDFKELLNDM